MTKPVCPQCHGLGYVDAPYYSDFEPSIQPTPCPSCQPAHEGSGRAVFLILALLSILAGLVAWGMP